MTHQKKTAHILIVEDSYGIQRMYSTVLGKAGYNLSLASSGTEAIELTKKHDFDAILLDIVLLDMDGMEFLKAFDTKKHPQTQVVIMSNMEDQKQFDEAARLGVHRYVLKKSLTPTFLLGIVKGAVGDADE